jgi:hypothetical protein
MHVPFPSDTDQFLEAAAVLQSQLNVRHELFGNVDREALPTATAVENVAAVAFSRGAGRAVRPHAGTLSK